MQPALIEAEALMVVAEFAPRWALIGVVLGVALALSVLNARVSDAPTLRGWQRFVHIASVAAIVLGGWLLGLRLLQAATMAETLARAALLLVVGLAAIPIAHDVIAGLALALEGRHRIGDDLRVDGHEGRVVGFGLRSVVLRFRDGTELTIPNRRFVTRDIIRLNLTRQDAPCEFEFAVPTGVELDAARKSLLQAAMLSPYAAPGRRPEVFVIADERGGLRLRVRAFVFDRAHEELFRGDVLTRAGLAEGRAGDSAAV